MANPRTPEEIERDIERERAELSGTIDSLQDRFSVDGVIQQVGDHLRENGSDIARNITATVKENPLGVALVGAGLAWLAFGKSAKEAATSSDPDFDRPGHGASVPGRLFGGHDAPEVSDERSRYGTYDLATARRVNAPYLEDDDPELDWLFADDDDDAYDETERSIWEGTKAKASDIGGTLADKGNAAGQSAKSAAQAAATSASDAASAAKGAASSAADSVAGKVSDAKYAAMSAAERATYHAEQLRARLSRGTEDLSEAARTRVIRARYAALRAKESAAQTGRAAADHSSAIYDRQPLAFGALAFAIGAAAAATLPRTRTEDETMGAHSDRMIRRAQRILQDEKDKLMAVAQATKDEAKEVVRDAKRDLEQKGTATLETMGDRAKSAATRVADRAETEAKARDLGKVEKIS